jgi:hypothetical protein
LYECSVHELSIALRPLSGVTTLTVNQAPEGPPPSEPLYQYLVQSFLAVIVPQLWSTKLRSLSFPGIAHVSLDFLPQLPCLQHLNISGYSLTPPRETLLILQQLPHLVSLELVGPPPGLAFHQRAGYRGPFARRSITPRVVLGLRALRSVSLSELYDPLCQRSSDPPWGGHTIMEIADADHEGVAGMTVCEEMLSALQTSHRHSLHSLRVSTYLPPSLATSAAMKKLLTSATNLGRLSIEQPPGTSNCSSPHKLRS